MNRIHQTLNVLAQAGRVRLDTEEIDALAYALDGLAPQRVALFGSRVEPDTMRSPTAMHGDKPADPDVLS